MLTGGGAGGALQLGEDGIQTFQHRRKVQLLIQPRLERLQPCEDITAAGDIRGRSAGIGVPLFAADRALIQRMALCLYRAVCVVDRVDVFLHRPVVTFGGEVLFIRFATQRAGVGRMAALQAGGGRVNGLRPVVLAGGGRVGSAIVLDDVLVAVGDIVLGDGHAVVTELHRDGGAVLQRDEVGAGRIVVRPVRHGVVIVGSHVVVVVGGLVDDGRVVVIVVGDAVVVVTVEVVDTGRDVVVVGDKACGRRCDRENGSSINERGTNTPVSTSGLITTPVAKGNRIARIKNSCLLPNKFFYLIVVISSTSTFVRTILTNRSNASIAPRNRGNESMFGAKSNG